MRTVRLLLFLFAVLCTSSSFAQLIASYYGKGYGNPYLLISTDYGNCGTGLKDSSGKWILEPHYDYVQWEQGAYIIGQGSREGLADRDGKLVLPVIYDKVETLGNDFWSRSENPSRINFYKITRNKKTGIADLNGRIVVPAAYDLVVPHNDNTFLARNGKKEYTVYREDGTSVRMDYHKKQLPLYAGCSKYIPRKKTFKKYTHPFSYRYYYPYYKSGLMDEKGAEILPVDYRAIGCVKQPDDLILTYSKNSVTLFRQNGEKLASFNQSTDSDYITSEFFNTADNYPDINEQGFEPFRLGENWGLISKSGDTILPFIYDKIYRAWGSDFRSDYKYYLVRKNGKDGLYDAKNRRWVLEPVYEYFQTAGRFWNYADSSTTYLFLLQKENRKGIYSSSGQEIFPFEIDYIISQTETDIIFLSNGLSYQLSFPQISYQNERHSYFYNSPVTREIPFSKQFEKIKSGNAVLYTNPECDKDTFRMSWYNKFRVPESFENHLHHSAIIIREIKAEKQISDTVTLYQFSNLGFKQDTSTEIKSILLINRKNGKYTAKTVSNMIVTPSHTFFLSRESIIRDDGKEIWKDKNMFSLSKSYCILENGDAAFIIEGYQRKVGVIDQDGKIRIDTAYNKIEYAQQNLFSVQYPYRSKKKTSKKDPDRYYYFDLVDFNTGKSVLPAGYKSLSEVKAGYHCAVIARSNSGCGIYNSDLKSWSVQPKYHTLKSLDSTGKYFAVKTCSGKIGIVSWDGRWLVDTVWTAMLNASYPKKYKPYAFRSKYESYVVLSQQGSWQIFDTQNGTTSTSRSLADTLLKRSCDNRQLIWKTESNKLNARYERVCSSCPMIDTTENQPGYKEMNSWQRAVLFDSLFAYQTYYEDTNLWYNRNGVHSYCCPRERFTSTEYLFSREYENNMMSHEIAFINENCVSVNRSGGFQKKHFTVMNFADGPHSMLLDSLFTGTEWKNFLIGEILNYLNSNSGVTGNCSNPAAIPIQLKNNFCIRKEGIDFYMNGYYQNHRELVISISWEKLSPYLREDVKEKIGIH